MQSRTPARRSCCSSVSCFLVLGSFGRRINDPPEVRPSARSRYPFFFGVQSKRPLRGTPSAPCFSVFRPLLSGELADGSNRERFGMPSVAHKSQPLPHAPPLFQLRATRALRTYRHLFTQRYASLTIRTRRCPAKARAAVCPRVFPSPLPHPGFSSGVTFCSAGHARRARASRCAASSSIGGRRSSEQYERAFARPKGRAAACSRA